MPDQVPGEVKRRRAARLAEIGDRLRRHFLESLAGRRLQVLVETLVKDRPGTLAGTSARYAHVQLPADEHALGQLVRVSAGPVVDGHIQATLGDRIAPHPGPDPPGPA